MTKDTGGAAFPVHGYSLDFNGMTLRDYFAAKSMQGILSASPETINSIMNATKCSGSVSELAYVMADAMLKARK